MTKQYHCGVDLIEFIRESNKIEGIHRDPTPQELITARVFVQLPVVTVESLCKLVDVFEPGAKLRDKPGMDVRVGSHFPPGGGVNVIEGLDRILYVHLDDYSPYEAHQHYENLHPFTDGNGRSGRMLWLWMMNESGDRLASLGFLHAWYYQSLSEERR